MKVDLYRIPHHGAALSLHFAASTKTWEARLAPTLAPHSLMTRAGWAVARCALAVAPHAQSIWIAAGCGNNGGDGFEAAGHLHRLGKQVVVSLLGDPAKLPLDAAMAWTKMRGAGVKVLHEDAAPPAADLVIDALLGIGHQGDRPLSLTLRATVERINAQTAPVLSIDLPSGLQANTGAVTDVAVRATHTLSLLTLKPGLFTAQGKDHAGTVWLDSLQCDLDDLAADALMSGPDAAQPWRLARPQASHKGHFGDVCVIGGAPGMTGAALLSARAALRAGAGRVLLSLLDAGALSHSDVAPELMFRPLLWQSHDAMANATVVAGCGGGSEIAQALPAALANAPRLVLDADALNAIAVDGSLRRQLEQRSHRGLPTVLTPHPLEAARLLQRTSAQAVQSDRLPAAQELAQRLACSVVLKGSGTWVASPGEVPRLNPTGNARLASAGSGDVLAGWMAGRWSARAQSSAHAVACCAAWEHGAAAMREPLHQPLTAGSLIDALAAG